MLARLAEALAPWTAPLCAFAGAVLMLLFRREMDPSRMVLAVVSGPFFAYYGTPLVSAGLAAHIDWLKPGESLTGLIGSVIGLLAINIVAFVAHVGQRAESIDPATLTRRP